MFAVSLPRRRTRPRGPCTSSAVYELGRGIISAVLPIQLCVRRKAAFNKSLIKGKQRGRRFSSILLPQPSLSLSLLFLHSPSSSLGRFVLGSLSLHSVPPLVRSRFVLVGFTRFSILAPPHRSSRSEGLCSRAKHRQFQRG